jgi:hypothetical protein
MASRLLSALAALVVCSLASGCLGFCVYDYDCPESQSCSAIKRCEPRVVPTPPSCTAPADCQDGRTCVDGVCRFAPACLNLSGAYDVYRADQGDAGAPDRVRLTQALGQCAVASSTLDGGGNVTLFVNGALDSVGAFTNQVDGGCAVGVGGDETLRLTCPQTGGTVTYHLYGASTGPDRFLPTRCSAGLVPCTGRRCEAGDAGPCASTVACPVNSQGIPQCTNTAGAP